MSEFLSVGTQLLLPFPVGFESFAVSVTPEILKILFIPVSDFLCVSIIEF